MSNATYNRLWAQSQHELERLATHDFDHLAGEPQLDRNIAQTRTFEFYLKYIMLSNKLDTIYDQMLQPQKRILVKKLLESCLGRVLELKQDLVRIDLTEFSYNEEIMAKYKCTPIDTELRVPKFFLREREEELKKRNEFMDDILKKIGAIEEEVYVERLSEVDAIKLIQLHERARQGRLRTQFMKEIKSLKEKGNKADRGKTDTGLLAAMKIQKVWRGHASRNKTQKNKTEEMVLIGMIPDPSIKTTAREDFENMVKERYKVQEKYQKNFEDTLRNFEESIKKKHGAPLMEDMSDEIRNWFRDYYNRSGKFPEFPSEELGGSRHLLSRQGTDSDMSRSSGLSSKESKKIEKTKDKGKKGEDEIELSNYKKGFMPDESAFLPEIKGAIDEYNNIWKHMDESSNLKQTHYADMIYAEKYTEVEIELRKIIDDMMRTELNMLHIALDKDRAAKGKKAKKAGKKGRKSTKKSKKKKEKDLTPDRTTESLFEELLVNGIIVKYPEFSIKSYIGDKSYGARSPTNPSPGDLRQLLTEYCILPLGSQNIKNFAPPIKSLLIAGPKGTGKKSLVHAVCTELGAVLFDLTPANIVGKYPGKTGLIMLTHLVSKVSRILQPSVIYFGDAEKPFVKKIPKTDKTDPKRFKKDLAKMVKNINPEDRVILIGTTNLPWDADQKLMIQAYTRIIYIPRPDYGWLSMAWKEFLRQYSSVSKSFDTAAMAKVC